MELNQIFSINSMSVHGHSSYNSLLAILFLNALDDSELIPLQCTMRVSISRFPLAL
jgi:hypothetical protein